MADLVGVDVGRSLKETDRRVNTGSMMLRDFQIDLKNDTYQAWNDGARNVMVLSPTGSGKTVVMGDIVKDFDGAPICAMAHRQELVSQIAMALNREEIPHGVIAPKTVIKEIIAAEMELHGRSHYSPRAAARVAGVDTLRNYDTTDRWLSQVKLVIPDEGHHVTRENKWGRAMGMFPNALGLLFTAHAHRADGLGLGRHADGVVDKLVLGPSGRNLINRGFLTDYRVICPPLPEDLDLADIPVGDNGELNMVMTRERINASKHIVGDVVRHYRKFADGELGITFAVDIQAAHKIADRFNTERIPAAVITAKTPISQRAHMMRQFRERQLLQLVNVDCLGEGTDVPACVVVSMARPTASFQLCAQQFGRMLRILVSDQLNAMWHGFTDAQRLAYIAASAKPRGILIDHVGNIALGNGAGRHGLPDRPRVYTLDRRDRRRQQPDDAIPLTTCLNPECLQTYEKVLLQCPHCQTKRAPPKIRTSPDHVDGDLFELDPSVLAELRGEIDRIDLAPRLPRNAEPHVARAIQNRHHERQAAQTTLREAMQVWNGWQVGHLSRPQSEAWRRFFHQFGVDAATAQTLGAREASELEAIIRTNLISNNVVKL